MGADSARMVVSQRNSRMEHNPEEHRGTVLHRDERRSEVQMMIQRYSRTMRFTSDDWRIYQQASIAVFVENIIDECIRHELTLPEHWKEARVVGLRRGRGARDHRGELIEWEECHPDHPLARFVELSMQWKE